MKVSILKCIFFLLNTWNDCCCRCNYGCFYNKNYFFLSENRTSLTLPDVVDTLVDVLEVVVVEVLTVVTLVVVDVVLVVSINSSIYQRET